MLILRTFLNIPTMNNKIMKEGLTYDDVLVVPAYSEVLPYMVSTSTQFSKNITLNIPVVSAVEGYALGGGMELALLCDIIIASKESKFGQPEINLGLIPGIGGTQRLKYYLGKYNANLLCMTGDIISGQRAYELGFVSVLLEKNNFSTEAIKVADKIAQKPKSSLIEIKKLISNNLNIENDIKQERNSFYKLLNNKNAKIGITAFLNKLKPKWED